MLKKGIIMSLFPSYAIIMEKGGAFHHIQLKEDMTIGQTILFTDEDIISHTPSFIRQFGPWLTLAATLILFLIPTIYTLQTPYAVISLDVNPSVELLLNKQGFIKKVTAKNDDGTKLELDNLKGQSLNSALTHLNTELTNKNFITSSPTVLVSYANLKTNNIELEILLQDYMEESFKDSHIVYLASDKSSYILSTKEHVSLGRYSASQLLSEQFPDIDFKTIDIPSLIHYLEPDHDLEDLEDTFEEILNDNLENDLDNREDTEVDDDTKDDKPSTFYPPSPSQGTNNTNSNNNSNNHLNNNLPGNSSNNSIDDDDDDHDDNDSSDDDDDHDNNNSSDDDDDHDNNNSSDDDDLDD